MKLLSIVQYSPDALLAMHNNASHVRNPEESHPYEETKPDLAYTLHVRPLN